MTSNKPEWEDQLKEKPFAGNHFTPQMQRRVEERLNGKPRSTFRKWAYAAAIGLFLGGIIWIGGVYEGNGPQQAYGPADVSASAQVTNGPDVTGPPGVVPTSAGTDSPPSTPLPGVDMVNRTLSFPLKDQPGSRVSIPLNWTEAALSIGYGDGPGSVEEALAGLPEMDFALPAELADQLQATLVYRPDGINGYLFLAPAGWFPAAVTGANGSFGVEFVDPKNPERKLNITDNVWSCVGCAINSIGTYFPEKAEWADSEGFTVYTPLTFAERHTLGVSGDAARTARYRLPADTDGHTEQGIVYYEEGHGYLFRQMQFSLPADEPDSALLEVLYDYFAVYHGALSVSPTGK